MSRKERWKVGIVAALLPTLLLIALAGVCFVVARFVAGMGPAEMVRKAEHYAQLAPYTPEHATVFFGDSITELCRIDDIYGAYSVESGVPLVNRGISAETTGSMLARLDESIITIRPRNLVMLMGINDLGEGVPQEQIVENIRQMILRVQEGSPETNIVLQAVYPIDPERDSLYERLQLGGREDNGVICALNEKLATVAQETNIRFLDVTELLADEAGNLRKDYTFDGLHPNVSGYLAVRESIIAELK